MSLEIWEFRSPEIKESRNSESLKFRTPKMQKNKKIKEEIQIVRQIRWDFFWWFSYSVSKGLKV